MKEIDEFRDWAYAIFYATPVTALIVTDPREPKRHYRQAAIAALRNWLLEPAQSGVLEVLRTGLAQLGWDTPSTSGRRLIADLIWRSVLNRFGLVPALSSSYGEIQGRIVIDVADSPSGRDTWDFSGWRIFVRIQAPQNRWRESKEHDPEIEFVLNALLYYDVELGLADRPLYDRLRPTNGRSSADKRGGLSSSSSAPTCKLCGAPMQIKNRSRTSEPFWGCSNYPACKGRLPLLPPVPRNE